MYVHEHSGHHQAALALAKAVKAVQPKAECRLVDALRYTHPILERLILRTYLGIVKRRPEVWERLYDNPRVVKSTQHLRHVIHNYHSHKFRRLLGEFQPDAIICTQAFPCVIVSDYKSTYHYTVPLYGILTDFLPHSYWAMDHVDRYFVPTEEAKQKLCQNGVSDYRVLVTGIPIDPVFAKTVNVASKKKVPTILIMGGGEGMGPIAKIVSALDKLVEPIEIIVVTGKNVKLYRKLTRQKRKLHKKITLYSYVENTATLMQNASILVSKPGGLTISEALASQLPVIFIDPIPGQEAKNASFLLRHGSAIEARSENQVSLLVSQLLKTPERVELMKKSMASLARPEAAMEIAASVLGSGVET